MADRFAKSGFINRLSDMMIPLITWLMITFPLWMSPFHPAIVAYFIIAFDLYYFYLAITNAYFATLSYRKILLQEKVKFYRKPAVVRDGKKISHFVIIPNYKEPLYKLESTLDSVIKNDLPHKENLYLVLAFETREPSVKDKSRRLIRKYGRYFKDCLVSYHTLKENEVAGKASNQTAAARILLQYVNEKGFDIKNVLITICDADSHLPKNYFSYLTYEYLKDNDRLYHFYWAPVLLYNNFWQLPLIVRMQATISSILRLAFLSDKDNLIQISTYSTNLWLLKNLNFWDVDIIPEDWHIYLQAFFRYGARVRTMPLFTIVSGDAVFSGGFVKTLVSRYEQEKRWAWGVSDVGYAIKKFFTTPEINPLLKLKKITYLAKTHILWPASFFILTISSAIPPLINPVFKKTVMGFLLPNLSGIILTFTSSMLIMYIYIDIKLRQRIKIKTNLANIPLLIIQWYFLPVISFFFSSLPALESHTRLLFGKKMKYKVTEKV